MDTACWCLRGSRAPFRDPEGFIQHSGPPPQSEHECIFIQPRRIPSDAYLPALSVQDDDSYRPQRPSRRSSNYGFTDENKPLPSSLVQQQQRKQLLQTQEQKLQATPQVPFSWYYYQQPQQKVSHPRRRARSSRLHSAGHGSRSTGSTSRDGVGSSTKEMPLATSTPRHTRALPRFSQHVPPHQQLHAAPTSPWPVRIAVPSARLSKPPLPPVAERGVSRRRPRRLVRPRDHFRPHRSSAKLATSSSRVVQEDPYSDISVVSPMPSLDVSYTAYLTPDVLTPTLLHLQPTATGQAQPRVDNYWFDEYGEPFVEHNPVYSPSECIDLPELTLSSFPSTSPPTPPFVHATNVFKRLDSVRRHLEKTSSFTPRILPVKPTYLPVIPPTSHDSLIDSDYETPDHFSDESKFSPRRETANVGTQTPDYQFIQYLYSQEELRRSSGESSAGSSPSGSPPILHRPPKPRSRSHKSSSQRKRRHKKAHPVITPLSPIAENNGFNGFNSLTGISTPSIISTITTAITTSSSELFPFIRPLLLDEEHLLSPYSSSPPSIRYGRITATEEPLPNLTQDSRFVTNGAIRHYSQSSRQLSSQRSRGITYSATRHTGRNGVGFRPHRKRFRRKRRSIALSREFLYVRMFDIKEDARFVYIILVLIQMFLRFEQVIIINPQFG